MTSITEVSLQQLKKPIFVEMQSTITIMLANAAISLPFSMSASSPPSTREFLTKMVVIESIHPAFKMTLPELEDDQASLFIFADTCRNEF